MSACHQRKIPVIAEKVETDEQFRRCREIGCDYFQGYFFCRPQIVGRKSVPANKQIYLQLLQAANESQFNLHKISRLFKRDVSLSYWLLRYLNSPAFGFAQEIQSIPHGLTLLGEQSIRKWISLVSVAALGDEVADGLLRLPLLRAMFCELLGQKIGMIRETNELFLLGLLSVMDALLNVPMTEVLAQVPVNHEIKLALLGSRAATGRFSKWYWITRAGRGSSWWNRAGGSGYTRIFCRICICDRSDRWAKCWRMCRCLRKSAELTSELGEEFFGDVKSVVGRGDAAIDGGLQKDFLNFLSGDAVVDGAEQVQTQFIAAIEGDGHGDGDEAASGARQSRARPDFSPSVTRN